MKEEFKRLLGRSKARADAASDRSMQVRYFQKIAKYGASRCEAKQFEVYSIIPAVFSHTGHIHGEFKILVEEQIRHKLISFEGEAQSSKIRSVMKWWSRCISMAIVKTASRNVPMLKWLG